MGPGDLNEYTSASAPTAEEMYGEVFDGGSDDES